MKPGERIVAEVTGLSAQGDGLAVVQGREVELRSCVPGDRVQATVRARHKGRLAAEVEEILYSAVRRVEPPCAHFGRCGGCRWQHLDYADQLRLKQEMVRSVLGSTGLIWPPVQSVVPSPCTLGYRNKMEFSFGIGRSGMLELGLHARGQYNRVFDLDTCHLQSGLSNRVVAAVRRRAAELGLPAYDLRRHAGLLRFLVVRDGKRTGAVMANLVVSSYPCAQVQEMCSRVLEDVPEIDTLVVTRHEGKAQTAVGQAEHLLKGCGTIVEECNGLEYEISARSFFQTNPLQAEELYRIVCRVAGQAAAGEVLDLYCGTGGVTLQLARMAQRVTGIESVPEAVADARRNVERNGLGNCGFRVARVEEALSEWTGAVPELVVSDPPRSGMHPRAVEALSGLAPPRIVYVSCNPTTLAADLVSLVRAGYSVDMLQPVDMFPHTPHCEVVAGLSRVST